jgi:hypothetical protein
MFDVVEIDRAERRVRLLQGRASLNLDKFILKLPRESGDDLVALLWRVLMLSNPRHQNTRVESDFGPHVRGDARRGM